MKVLLIETASGGHHDYYAGALEKAADETVYVVPSEICGLSSRQVIVDSGFVMRKSYTGYFVWLSKIRRIVQAENPDVIHFLYGDIFYRYFALWLKRSCCGRPCIMTCHHVRRSRHHDFSLRRISHAVSKLVVHTSSLKSDLEAIGIRNVEQVDYPELMNIEKSARNEALSRLGVSVNHGEKVLLALGGTRRDKGLDILLEALKNVKGSFHLLIAGIENTFKREFILKESEGYRSSVMLKLGYLDEQEYSDCLNAADIVVLPYRKIFDGMSGPMTDGAFLGKMIVGPSHKSLGALIRDNHLGLTFEAENPESLAQILDEALCEEFQPDEKYRDYQAKLSGAAFVEHYRQIYEDTAIMAGRR